MTRMHNPAHPGEVLREYLPERMSVTEAARRNRRIAPGALGPRKWPRGRERRYGVMPSPPHSARAQKCGSRCNSLTTCGRPSSSGARGGEACCLTSPCALTRRRDTLGHEESLQFGL